MNLFGKKLFRPVFARKTRLIGWCLLNNSVTSIVTSDDGHLFVTNRKTTRLNAAKPLHFVQRARVVVTPSLSICKRRSSSIRSSQLSPILSRGVIVRATTLWSEKALTIPEEMNPFEESVIMVSSRERVIEYEKVCSQLADPSLVIGPQLPSILFKSASSVSVVM